MSDLVAAFLIWIAGQTGLAMPAPPPVVLISEGRLNELASGRSDVGQFRGLYNREEGIVYLPESWNPADIRNRATLLHELVHHVQIFNKVPVQCPAQLEVQAYDVTIKWLREQGIQDPYEVLKIDECVIALISMCRD